MKSYIIHLVRHGMTANNLEGRYAGNSDVPLCDEGIARLRELKEKYDYTSPELIFSSPLSRCIETVRELYGDDREITVVDGLHEISFGDFEGKTAEELLGTPGYEDWLQGKCPPPNGESNEDFARRICTAFVQTVREILKTGKTTAAICAHGGVIMTLLSVYGISDEEGGGLRWMANNGCGFTIRVTPSLWMRTGMVEVLSEYPRGSADEPDLSINPVKNSAQRFDGGDSAENGGSDSDFSDEDGEEYYAAGEGGYAVFEIEDEQGK